MLHAGRVVCAVIRFIPTKGRWKAGKVPGFLNIEFYDQDEVWIAVGLPGQNLRDGEEID
jgi:hypothetical protein